MKIHWPLLAACLLTALSAPALAQTIERPAAAEPPPEPLPRGKDSEDGGGKLQVSDLSLTLGGYVQPGFVSQVDTPFNSADSHDGFEFANARLTAKGKQELNDHFFLGLEFGFDVATGSFDPKDVFGTLGLKNELVMLDVGQMKQPFGLALMQSEAQLQFPLAARVRELAFGRDQGARLRGQIELEPMWIGWGVMIANGEGGFRARRNIDDEFIYTGRIEVSLREPLKSESDLWDSDLRVTAGGSFGYTPSLGKGFGIDDVGLAETRYGADVRAVFHGATARAELIGAKRDGRDGASDVNRRAIAVQAGYVLPLPFKRPQIEPVARMEISDINRSEDGFPAGEDPVVDNTERRTLEFGANVYIEEHRAKLQIAYRLTDLLEGPETDGDGNPLIGDEVFVFMQFGWF